MKDKPKLDEAAIRFFAAFGREGGKIRAQNLTKEERKRIAKKASKARWEKWKKEKEREHGRKG